MSMLRPTLINIALETDQQPVHQFLSYTIPGIGEACGFQAEGKIDNRLFLVQAVIHTYQEASGDDIPGHEVTLVCKEITQPS